MNQYPYERVTAYRNDNSMSSDSADYKFRLDSGNMNFSPTFLTWINLAFLLVGYVAISLLGVEEDPTAMLKNLNEGMLTFLLVTTVLFQWAIFGLNYGGVYTENTGLRGVGFRPLRGIDFLYAIAFLIPAYLFLSVLAWGLGQIGLPLPGEIGLLVPQTGSGRVLWVVVSFTAGFCEEVAFRGYLMTRLRLVGKFKSWVFPVIISSVVFGACHAYQGWPGFILITIYGSMFALLYIKTKTLWPGIIAHSLQDLSALFIPQ